MEVLMVKYRTVTAKIVGSTPMRTAFELLYFFCIFIYMGRKQKKYHYIYKTTNVINGKYYIGMHSTDNLNDGYIGSGKRLWYSINHYGKENHICEILEYCKDREALSKREEEIVNQQLLGEDLCMNLALGGGTGFDFINDNNLNNKCGQFLIGGKASAEKLKTDDEYRKTHSERSSILMTKMHSEGKIRYNTFTDKKHSDESKKKMSESKKGQGKGEHNSQYGSCWITNEINNKKMFKSDVIPEGWRFGRKIK